MSGFTNIIFTIRAVVSCLPIRLLLPLFFIGLFSFIGNISLISPILAEGSSGGNNFSLGLEVPISLSLRLDKSFLALSGSGDQFAFTKNTAYVSTNSTHGYTLTISSNNEFTDLEHSSLDGQVIASITQPTSKDKFPSKAWGYSLDNDIFSPIPKLSTAKVLKNTKTFGPIEEPVDFYIGAKISSDTLSGNYQKLLIFTAIANPTGESTFGGITKMQEMTQDICSSETTPHAFIGGGDSGIILSSTTRIHTADKNYIPEAELIDIRDGKKYVIRKLADGNCWMVKNLDLGDTEIELSAENTDLNGTPGFILPAAQVSPSPWGSHDDSSSVNSLRIFNVGDRWAVGVALNRPGTVVFTQPVDSEEKLLHIGNYYNWYTATAKTGTFELFANQETPSSICPKGWRLPPNSGVKSYTNLTQAVYKLTINHNDNFQIEQQQSSFKLRSKPFSFPLSGNYNYSGAIANQASNGWFWSSTARSNNYAHYLYLYYARLYPAGSNSKAHGFNIRCQAR